MGAKVFIFDKILNATFLKSLRYSAMSNGYQEARPCPLKNPSGPVSEAQKFHQLAIRQSCTL